MVKNKYPIIWICIYAFLLILSSVSGASLELVYSIAFLMVLSQSLNIALGFSGLVNLGIIAFSGVGAYTFAVLVYQNLNPYLSMIVGGLTSVIIALLIGVVVLRLKGPFFAIGTLTLMFAAKYFIIGTGIAGGSYGLTLYKYIGSLYDPYMLAYVLLTLSIIVTILTYKLANSPLGYSLKALREDHDAAQTMGVDAFKSKLTAFAISSIFPGIAGGVLAFKIFWVRPVTVFDPSYTIEAVLTVLMGGAGSVTGPIIGALIYEILKEVLMRLVPGLQLPIFAILVIIVASFAPQGIVGLLRTRFKKLQNFII